MSKLAIKHPHLLLTAQPDEIEERLDAYFRSARGAFSANTLKAIRSDLSQFIAWCDRTGTVPVPATASTLATYVDETSHAFAPATVRRRLASIRHIHYALEEHDATKAGAVQLALRRMDRTHGTRQQQADPIGEHEVTQILACIGTALIDLRDAAMLLTARDLLARCGELVSLKIEDIDFAEDGTATVLIRQSKADQGQHGAILWLSKQTTKAVKRWINESDIHDGPLFRSVRKGGRVGWSLSSDDVSRRFKILAENAGIDPQHISGHSTRIGMAQDLCAAGAEITEMMVAGRWKSPRMPAHYAEKLKATRGAVAKYHAKK